MLPTLQLLHHLVYPAPLPRPSSSLATPTKDDEEITPQGVDLARKLQEPGEYTGLSHLFVATLGGIAYAEVDIDDGAWAYAALVPRQERRRKMDLNDLRLMQCEWRFRYHVPLYLMCAPSFIALTEIFGRCALSNLPLNS